MAESQLGRLRWLDSFTPCNTYEFRWWLRIALLFLANCSSVELSLRQQDRNLYEYANQILFHFHETGLGFESSLQTIVALTDRVYLG
ncbi:hypothetical protein KC19_6G172400 [Ceratodon purpureus]|uniref:Uncharacterized protein n=1 Tax=Ceratodon purpureus TaxID=3225 RepID=A0A8T0HG29_CERPU|nr:hypothetical protein KC19_6G172400 [Ceratodon purpureus]